MEDSAGITLSIEENERVMLSLHELEALIPVRHWGDPLDDYCMESMINLVNVFTPSTRKQALRCEQADVWMNAERKEIESIISKKVLKEPFIREEGSFLRPNGCIRLSMELTER